MCSANLIQSPVFLRAKAGNLTTKLTSHFYPGTCFVSISEGYVAVGPKGLHALLDSHGSDIHPALTGWSLPPASGPSGLKAPMPSDTGQHDAGEDSAYSFEARLTLSPSTCSIALRPALTFWNVVPPSL